MSEYKPNTLTFFLDNKKVNIGGTISGNEAKAIKFTDGSAREAWTFISDEVNSERLCQCWCFDIRPRTIHIFFHALLVECPADKAGKCTNPVSVKLQGTQLTTVPVTMPTDFDGVSLAFLLLF